MNSLLSGSRYIMGICRGFTKNVHPITPVEVTFRAAGVTFTPAEVIFRPAGVMFTLAEVIFRPAGVTFRPAGVTFTPAEVIFRLAGVTGIIRLSNGRKRQEFCVNGHSLLLFGSVVNGTAAGPVVAVVNPAGFSKQLGKFKMPGTRQPRIAVFSGIQLGGVFSLQK